MSRDTLSSTLIEAVLSQETEEVYLFLITLSSSEWGSDLRFVNNYEDVSSGGNTYTGYPFQISLPNDQESRLPTVALVIDNVSQDIIDEIRLLTEPPTVSMSLCLASSPNTIEDGPYTLTLRETSWDRLTITGRLQGDDLLNQRYGQQFTPENAPGIFP